MAANKPASRKLRKAAAKGNRGNTGDKEEPNGGMQKSDGDEHGL